MTNFFCLSTNLIRNYLKIFYFIFYTLIFLFHFSCSKEEPKSSENTITSFQLDINNTIHDGMINQQTGKITFEFANELPVSLTPVIKFPSTALISPTAGSAQNFNKITRYTVTAENGLEKAYTIVIKTSNNDVGNVPPGTMELVNSTFEGREVLIDWTDAVDSDEVIYKVFQNSIEVGEYLVSEAKFPFTYNAIEKIEIFATDKKGGTSKLEVNLETPKSELLFVQNFSGILLCIDTKVQDILWVDKSRDRFFSPAVVMNEVLIFSDNGLVGLDILDGKERTIYDREIPNVGYNDFLRDNTKIYFKKGGETGGMSAINLNNLEVEWSDNILSYALTPSRLHNTTIFSVGPRNHELHSSNKMTGTINWSFEARSFYPGAFATFDATPVVIDNSLLVSSSGYMFSLNIDSGQLNWTVLPENNRAPSSFTPYKDYVIAISERLIFAFNYETGAILWTNELPDFVSATPFLYEDRLYVGTNGNGIGSILSIDPTNGNIIWERAVSDSVTSSPVVFEGKVYFADWDGFLYCYDADNGSRLWRITIGATIITSPTFVKGNGEIVIYPKLIGFD